MKPRTVSVALPTASATSIAASQKPLGAGNLTLTSSPFKLDAPRRIAVASDANDSAHTITITGTDRYGNAQSETLTGPNSNTVTSVNDYASVTTVAINAAATGNLTVGTSATGSSAWVPLNYYAFPGTVGIAVELTGAATYTVEQTYDNVLTTLPPYVISNSGDNNVVAATTAQTSSFTVRPFAVRVKATSGTGTVSLIVSEPGPV